MLSERKKKILRAVVNENIKKPQAISSKDLKEKYLEEVSTATIRNDLMALEEMGYLFQPHTSAGRVPTAEGFKKYISELMPEKELSNEELHELKKEFNSRINGVEELAQVVAKSISSVSEYASVVYVNELLPAVVQSVKLVRVFDDEALIIVVTDVGVIKDLTISIDDNLSDNDIAIASRFLTQVLAGKTLLEASDEETIEELSMLAEKYKELFKMVLDAIKNKETKPILKIEGTSNLLRHPEYDNPEEARKTLKLFESKEVLAPLLETGNDVEISIRVGEDNLENCSVVSATYKINGKNVGRAGIVGPVRMDYAKAVSILKEVNSVIDDGFKRNKNTLKGDENGTRKIADRRTKEKN